jgi:DNA invertase Pin-like site-specific DNA recombinase
MLRAGLYARVSTNDQQTLPMQNRALREYAARRGWAVATQVREVSSGTVERKAREQLMEAAGRREIDVVLVWRLDRWRRSVTDLLATLQELEHLGVGFVSPTEALDLTTSRSRDGRPAGNLRRVRTWDPAGTHALRTGSGAVERQTAGSANHGGTARH